MYNLAEKINFMIEKSKEKSGEYNFKTLEILYEDKFEGVRLLLKKMKVK